MTNKIEITREQLERWTTGRVSLAHLDEMRELLAAAPVAPYVKPQVCTHGEPGDDAACMDCLKAWGQWPFPAPVPQQGGRQVPFNTLCYGAKFKYSESDTAVWVKVRHDVVAGWEPENVASSWVGQPLCSFCDDENLAALVWLVDDAALPARVEPDASGDAWHPLTGPGQIQLGDKIAFTLAGKKIEATARLILNPGEPTEEIVYDRRKNYYFITSMAVAGTSSHKHVLFARCDTCKGNGVIGWTTGQTPETFDQDDAPCPDCQSDELGLPEPDQLFEAISEALGEAMDCTRVWAAWGTGTMSEDDFTLVADDPERLREIATACMTRIKELSL